MASVCKMASRRYILSASAGVLGSLLAGCIGAPEASSPDLGSETTTAGLPKKRHRLPEGPKSPPDTPEIWTEKTAREYATEYESKHIYNMLYEKNVSEINAGCGVTESETVDGGYRIVLLCEGAVYYQNKDSHGDYIGRPVTYLVGEGTAIRRESKRTS